MLFWYKLKIYQQRPSAWDALQTELRQILFHWIQILYIGYEYNCEMIPFEYNSAICIRYRYRYEETIFDIWMQFDTTKIGFPTKLLVYHFLNGGCGLKSLILIKCRYLPAYVTFVFLVNSRMGKLLKCISDLFKSTRARWKVFKLFQAFWNLWLIR